MIQEVRIYLSDGEPKEEDILKAIDIVKRDGCLIRLQWHMEYSGMHEVIVAHDSTLESVKAQLPKFYPV